MRRNKQRRKVVRCVLETLVERGPGEKRTAIAIVSLDGKPPILEKRRYSLSPGGAEIATFSLGFNPWEFDEIVRRRQVIRDLFVKHHPRYKGYGDPQT